MNAASGGALSDDDVRLLGGDGSIPCRDCAIWFDNRREWREHRRTRHKETDPDDAGD